MTAVQKSSTWSTSGMRAVYRNGLPDSVNTYNVPITSTLTRIPVAYEPSYRDNGLYVQDKWTPMRKLTVNAGLRFETTYGWQPAACQVETIFVAGQCFPEIKGAPDFKALVPRVSAVYDLFGDGRTAHQVLREPLRPADHASERAPTQSARRDQRHSRVDDVCRRARRPLRSQRRPRAAVERAWRLERLHRSARTTATPTACSGRIPPSSPSSSSASLPGNIVVSAGYTRRETARNIGPRNVAVPFEQLHPADRSIEANSGRQVTVYNQDPALRGKTDVVWENNSAAGYDVQRRRLHRQQAHEQSLVRDRRRQLSARPSATSIRPRAWRRPI